MSIRRRNQMIMIAFLFMFFVIGSVANVTWDEPVSLTSTMVFSCMCIIWTASIRARIISRRQKRYFTALGLMMLLWMMERAVKFSRLFTDVVLERHLWYAYYIFMSIMPLISLLIALCLDKTDKEPINRKVYLLFIPALVLSAGFMTNDLHQWAFRFNPGFENWVHEYSYGFLYFLALAWIVGCMIVVLYICVRHSTANNSKKRGLIPLAVILFSLGFVGVYILTDFRLTRLMNVTELFCLCFAAFWEACLQTGLIPSNTGYDLLFKQSHLCAQICDNNGNVVYQTAWQNPTGVIIEHEQAIPAGKIHWREDVTLLTEQKKELERANAALLEQAQIQQEENKLKEEKMQLEEQQRIYERINSSLAPQTEHISRLVDAAREDEAHWQENMLWVCVIGAYIKRKSNLMLLAARSESIPLSELHLAYKESLSYLTKAGVTGSIGKAPDILLPSQSLLYAYDEFETVLESKMPEIHRVKIDIKEKKTGILFDIKVDETPLLFELEGMK